MNLKYKENSIISIDELNIIKDTIAFVTDITKMIDIEMEYDNELLAHDIYGCIDEIVKTIDSHPVFRPELKAKNDIYLDYIGGQDVECDCWVWECKGNLNNTKHFFKFDFDSMMSNMNKYFLSLNSNLDIEDVCLEINDISNKRKEKEYCKTYYGSIRYTDNGFDEQLYYHIKIDLKATARDGSIYIESEWTDY